MPRTMIPANESPEDRAVREVLQEDDANIDAIVAQAGPPPDASKMSETDEDLAWSETDPTVSDIDGMAQRLAVQGLTQQEAQSLLVVKLMPDVLPVFMKPTGSLEIGRQYAQVARFPFRWALMEDMDPEEQVAYAEKRMRRYVKNLTQMMEEMGNGGNTSRDDAHQPDLGARYEEAPQALRMADPASAAVSNGLGVSQDMGEPSQPGPAAPAHVMGG